MDGFKRPQRPTEPTRPREPAPPEALPASQPPVAPAAAPIDSHPVPPLEPSEQPLGLGVPKRRRWIWWVGGSLVAMVLVVVGLYVWYKHALTPVDPNDGTVQQVQITQDSTFSFVSGRLQKRNLIRSALALQIYAKLHGQDVNLKQGACNLSPNESAVDILAKLTGGCHDFIMVTFYPGATLEPSKNLKPGAQDYSVRGSLRKAGFSDNAITAAFAMQYSGPLFAGRPAGASLEGYVYGDTFYVNTDDGPQQVLQKAFGEMQNVVEQDKLVTLYKARGLTLYQGITMASLVERELSCSGNLDASHQAICHENQQKIAQVFYSRLAANMPLGSDVTFIYAAGLTGQTPSPTIDSPYNTRIHTGLPPGPIASPSEFALKAVTNPASTDYLYFIAGDEGGGAMYFAHTEAEHQANIKNHCQQQCL